MASTPSIKILKSFAYRGSPRIWSNRYHFNGGVPASGTAWTTLADAVVAAEKFIYPTTQGPTIVGAVGYLAGSDVPVFNKTYTTAPTGGTMTGVMCPGDVAALIRYATSARTSKNHPVYLFNYYHGCAAQAAQPWDAIWSQQKTAMMTYAAAWLAGFSDGSHTCVRAGPNGTTATGYLVEDLLTHRDLAR